MVELRIGPELKLVTFGYSCLRSYGNQHQHDEFRRGDALAVLGSLLGITNEPEADPTGLDLVVDEARDLARALLKAEAPTPSIVHELSPKRTPLELTWPRDRVAVVVGADDDRDRLLDKQGWHYGQPDSFTCDEIMGLLSRSR